MKKCTSLEKKRPSVEFTQEQIEEIVMLAGLNYTVSQIAMYFDIPLSHLEKEFEEEDSVFRYNYNRGRLIVNAKVDQQAVTSAYKGNITAIQILKKSQKDTVLNNLKYELFGIR